MDRETLGMRFAAGGEAELEEVIGAYGEKLLRYATSILCHYQDAEDVVQRVFLAAYQNRRKFTGQYLSGWLYKITCRLCLNQLKKRKLLLFARIESQLSYEELSLIFGRSPAALRKQYERAKKKLSGYLNDQGIHGKESNHAYR